MHQRHIDDNTENYTSLLFLIFLRDLPCSNFVQALRVFTKNFTQLYTDENHEITIPMEVNAI